MNATGTNVYSGSLCLAGRFLPVILETIEPLLARSRTLPLEWTQAIARGCIGDFVYWAGCAS